MLQMHLIENIFFPISRISISLEVNFVLIERVSFFFSSTSLSKDHFLSQCILQKPCGPTWLWEANTLAARSSSPTVASPTASVSHRCLHWTRSHSFCKGAVLGQRGRSRRELVPRWGTGAASPPSLLGPAVAGWQQNRHVCKETQQHGSASLGFKPKELSSTAWTKHPTKREDKGKPLAAHTALLQVAGQSPKEIQSKPWFILLDAHPAHRLLLAEVCIILGCTWEKDSATWTVAAIP